MDADYWVRNLRQCVLLAPAVTRLSQSGHNIFIELSPHPILLPSIQSAAGEVESARPRSGFAQTRETVPRNDALQPGCHVRGRLSRRMGALLSPGRPMRDTAAVSLPARALLAGAGHGKAPGNCGPGGKSAARPPIHFVAAAAKPSLWESRIGLARDPISDRSPRDALGSLSGFGLHRDGAFRRARFLIPDRGLRLARAAFVNAAYLPEEGSRIFQLAMTPEGGDGILVRNPEPVEEQGDADWMLHATGALRGREQTAEQEGHRHPAIHLDSGAFRHRYAATRNNTVYDGLAKSGLHYGPAFQLVEQAWVGERESLCRLRGDVEQPEPIRDSSRNFGCVFPGDGAWCVRVTDGFHPEDTYLPVAIKRFHIYEAISQNKLGSSRRHSWPAAIRKKAHSG